jgi:phosphate transport system substrate-binding protein
VEPNPGTIESFKYPISRPIFIYVNPKAAARPEVDAFVNFYIDNCRELVPEVGYIPLTGSAYALAKARFAKRVTGSIFNKPSAKGKSADAVLSAAK